MHIVLYQPEIPPNTGNIIRLAANTAAKLHLIHPLGFAPDDKALRRAGLDYHEWARIYHHNNFENFISQTQPSRIIACSTKGTQLYNEINFAPNDFLLFGPETRGLPSEILNTDVCTHTIRIPMGINSRSLNLANSVAIILYEALRQIGFSMLSLR